MMYSFLWSLMQLVLRVYVRSIHVNGQQHLPANGPVIFACNHTNAFMDAVLTACNVPLRFKIHFLTRSDVFKGWWIPLLRSMNMIPVYRMRDGRKKLNRNEESFAESTKALANGYSILIFSEGICIPEKRVQQLLKGTARITFQALESGVDDLLIVPVGINYSDLNSFRMDVMLNYGKPIKAVDWLAEWKTDQARTILSFNEMLENRIRSISFHIEENTNDQLFDEAVYMLDNIRPVTTWRTKNDRVFEKQKLIGSKINDGSLQELAKAHQKLRVKAGLDQDEVDPPQSKITFATWIFHFASIFFTWIPRKLAERLVHKKIKNRIFISSVRMTLGMFLYAFWLLFILGSTTAVLLISNQPVWPVTFLMVLAIWLSLKRWKSTNKLQLHKKYKSWQQYSSVNPAEAAELVSLRNQLQKIASPAEALRQSNVLNQ